AFVALHTSPLERTTRSGLPNTRRTRSRASPYLERIARVRVRDKHTDQLVHHDDLVRPAGARRLCIAVAHDRAHYTHEPASLAIAAPRRPSRRWRHMRGNSPRAT